MALEIGKYYLHISGYLIHMLAEIKTSTGKKLMSESTQDLGNPRSVDFNKSEFSSATEQMWKDKISGKPVIRKRDKNRKIETYTDLGEAPKEIPKDLVGQTIEVLFRGKVVKSKIIKAYIPAGSENLFVDLEPIGQEYKEMLQDYCSSEEYLKRGY